MTDLHYPRRTLRGLLSLLLTAVVVVVTGMGLVHYRDQAKRETRSRLVLANVQASTNRLDGLEWRAISSGRVDPEVSRMVDSLRRQIERGLSSLSRKDRGQAGASFKRYASALETELRLLEQGRFAAAERIDEERVDPTFERLHRQLDRGAQLLATRATATDRRSTTASLFILGLAGLAVAGLLWTFFRSRERALTASLRESALERQVEITDQLAREREHEANHDELTGLASRRFFLARLDEEVTRAYAADSRLAVLMIDLNNFKDINDTLGHEAGDTMIGQVAARLLTALRQHDLLARIGGDEFALLVPAGEQIDTTLLTELSQRLADKLGPPFDFQGLTLQLSASIGIATYPDHGIDAETLLRHADVAMYRAKAERTGPQLYAPDRDETSVSRLNLAGELRDAIVNDQLRVHYQPQLDLGEGTVNRVEALVRWQHPKRGLMAPNDFVPIAEQVGLMGALTNFMLETSLAQCARWRRQGSDIAVAVNLSSSDLTEDLPTRICALLARHGVPPACLQLEITETVIMADPVRATAVIAELASRGIRISLDDFGTGYSSLASLKRLNVHEIKIDRTFLVNLVPDCPDAAIVRSTIELARTLDLRVVAEGVETGEVLEQLRCYGCHVAQGFYISRPLPADQLTPWLDHRSSSQPVRTSTPI